MICRAICVLLLGVTFAVGALGAPPKQHNDPRAVNSKVIRRDPASRAGYMDGYRQGSNDSEALSNSYKDESGPLYAEALDGYSPQYGDQATYQKLFRQGYIEGYKVPSRLTTQDSTTPWGRVEAVVRVGNLRVMAG